VGKVEDALRDLIRYHGKRTAVEVMGETPAQLRDVRREIAALARTVEGLTEQVRKLVQEGGGPAKPQPELEQDVEVAEVTPESLKELRQAFDLTQRELARLLDVSPVTVASWESGKTHPRHGRAVQIAAVESMDQADIDDAIERDPAPPPIAGPAVKKLRSRIGVTQAELARLAEVSVAAVTSWEAGRTAPGRESRRALAMLDGLKPAQVAERLGLQKSWGARLAATREAELAPGDIKGLRQDAGLSQAKMAEQLGVSTNTVCNWETGRSAPRAKSLAKLLAMQKK